MTEKNIYNNYLSLIRLIVYRKEIKHIKFVLDFPTSRVIVYCCIYPLSDLCIHFPNTHPKLTTFNNKLSYIILSVGCVDSKTNSINIDLIGDRNLDTLLSHSIITCCTAVNDSKYLFEFLWVTNENYVLLTSCMRFILPHGER